MRNHSADQRYYASSYGRFNSPDPYKASGSKKDPGSWNRYAYVGGDPINFNDPHGLDKCGYFWTGDGWGYQDCQGGGAEGGGGGGCGENGVGRLAPMAACGGGEGGAPGGSGDTQGYDNARDAFNAFASTQFSPQCEKFIDNVWGDGSLATLQGDTSAVNLVDASTVNSAAGAVLFPNDPTLAAAEQARDDKLTGIAGSSLAQVFAASPTTYAEGQYNGTKIYYSDGAFAGFGSGYALYTIFHEMLHVAGLGGDKQIAAAFGISPDILSAQGSQAITYKLIAECGN